LEIAPFESLGTVSYLHFVATIAVSLTLCKMAPFDRPYTTFYWSAIVSIALACTIFKLFNVE